MTGFTYGGVAGASYGGEHGGAYGIGAPSPPTEFTVTDYTADTISLSWQYVGLADGVTVYRAESSGEAADITDDTGTYERVATVDSPTDEYTDEGLTNGRRYYYRLTAYNAIAESDPTDEVDEATALPPPEAVELDTSTIREIAVSWTTVDNNGDGDHEIYRSRDGSLGTIVATVAADTTAVTDTNTILDGEQYYYTVRRSTDDRETDSEQASDAAFLPDAEGLQLDASEQDQFGAEWDAVLNNGSYRLELRDDDPDGDHPDYEAEATLDYETLTHTIEDLRDGEQYSVRLRTETDYRTGAWLTADEITKFPAPDGFTLDPDVTSVELEWESNADQRERAEVHRAREYSGGWTDHQEVESARNEYDAGEETDATIDETVLPGSTYRYYVRERTEWVFADSSTVETTTDPSGFEGTRTGSTGWYVEIDHPDGRTLTPRVLDGAAIRPAVNDYPEVEIPVERSDKWRAQAFEDAPLRAWKDGTRQPVDTLIDVETQPDRTILRGRGGSQLQRRAEAEFDNTPVHEAAGELLDAHTDYATNIDAPDTTGSEQIVQQPTTTSEWLGVTQDTDLSTLPITISEDQLRLQQSCFTAGYDAVNDDDFEEHADYTEATPTDGVGVAVPLESSGEAVDWTFDIGYTIPESAVGIYLRDHTPEDGSPEVAISLDGIETGRLEYDDSIGGVAISWTDFAQPQYNDDTDWTGGDLEPGEHTIRVDVEQSGPGPYVVDHVALVDTRYDRTFDNDVTTAANGANYLDGPEHYTAETVRFDAYESVLSVLDGDLTVDIDDTTGDQHVGITNDGDDALITAANSDTIAGEFDEPTGEIQAEVHLSRYGDAGEGETPRFGIKGQAVDSYELTAGLDDTPLLIARSFDGQLIDILRDIADDGTSAFEFRRDADGQGVVEWTQIGQRTSEQAIEPSDYQVQKRTDERYQRAVVYGSNQSVRREQVAAEYDVAIPLANERVQPGSESVYDPDAGDGDTETFEREADYELNYREGTIEVLADGNMTAGATYRIDYSHETQGTYTAPHAEDWDEYELATTVEELPDLTTDRACEQAALRIVSAADSPRYEATVTVPRDADFSVVETLSIPGFPETDALHIRQVETSPSETVLSLGSRQTVDEVMQDIRSRIQSVSRRV